MAAAVTSPKPLGGSAYAAPAEVPKENVHETIKTIRFIVASHFYKASPKSVEELDALAEAVSTGLYLSRENPYHERLKTLAEYVSEFGHKHLGEEPLLKVVNGKLQEIATGIFAMSPREKEAEVKRLLVMRPRDIDKALEEKEERSERLKAPIVEIPGTFSKEMRTLLAENQIGLHQLTSEFGVTFDQISRTSYGFMKALFESEIKLRPRRGSAMETIIECENSAFTAFLRLGIPLDKIEAMTLVSENPSGALSFFLHEERCLRGLQFVLTRDLIYKLDFANESGEELFEWFEQLYTNFYRHLPREAEDIPTSELAMISSLEAKRELLLHAREFLVLKEAGYTLAELANAEKTTFQAAIFQNPKTMMALLADGWSPRLIWNRVDEIYGRLLPFDDESYLTTALHLLGFLPKLKLPYDYLLWLGNPSLIWLTTLPHAEIFRFLRGEHPKSKETLHNKKGDPVGGYQTTQALFNKHGLAVTHLLALGLSLDELIDATNCLETRFLFSQHDNVVFLAENGVSPKRLLEMEETLRGKVLKNPPALLKKMGELACRALDEETKKEVWKNRATLKRLMTDEVVEEAIKALLAV